MKCHLFLIFWQWAYPKYSRKENESKSFFEENEPGEWIRGLDSAWSI